MTGLEKKIYSTLKYKYPALRVHASTDLKVTFSSARHAITNLVELMGTTKSVLPRMSNPQRTRFFKRLILMLAGEPEASSTFTFISTKQSAIAVKEKLVELKI